MVIVTGFARSGTSAMARLLHESGIDMGLSFLAPTPGRNDMPIEYEESIGALHLMQRGCFPEGYWKWRESTKRTEIYGFKSPLCMFHLDELRKLGAVVIKMERDFAEAQKSTERLGAAGELLAGINERMRGIECGEALRVDMYELKDNPDAVLARVRERVICHG